ncbi:MAG: acetate--CoA ligase family protein [Rhodocyclaceae bacterium]|nr:acetate--CoA ligase family protein [Rhodocyclaceae bacterium]
MTPVSSSPLYRADQLSRTFAPRSIAIVGVSNNPGAFGSITHANIVRKGGFTGPVYMVNSRSAEIGGERCYPSISALPETPDCVFIAVPREAVEGVVAECAQRGVGGVVLYASGYAETGLAERVQQQQRLLELARAADMRILGPNCVGFMNYGLGLLGTFVETSFKSAPRPLSIGLVSQSGAIGSSLSQAMEHGTSFTHMLTCGNASDIDVADQVAYLAQDPLCKAVACLFEGMADPKRFLAAAELCHRAGKPLVVHKLGTSERGAQAAVSHTGSVAGSQAAYRATFERAGIIMVDNIESLIETTVFFAKAPQPKARGVAVAAVSGGACILLADKAEVHGVELPHPTPAAMAVLERLVPEYGAPGNPCDMTAQMLYTPEHLRECFDALLADPQYGILVVPHNFAYAAATNRVNVLGDAAAQHGKMACVTWLTQHLEGPGAEETERNDKVALFRSMDSCMAAIAKWHRRADWMASQGQAQDRMATAAARQLAAALLDRASNATLTEREGKEVLACYGVPVVRETLVQNADEAVAAALASGGPVVLKLESPDIAHKTEAGVIRLGLTTPEQVRTAFAEVMANAGKVTPTPRINGVLVQPMVPQGVEIMVGARVDPQFGPLVVVGLGGVFVELLKDTSVRPAPVGCNEALAMLQALKGHAVLQGFRGAEPVNLERLAEVIARISEFVADHAERLTELDVNPLICAGDRIVAVDALIVKRALTP